MALATLIPQINVLEMTSAGLDAMINGDPGDPMDTGVSGAATGAGTVADD